MTEDQVVQPKQTASDKRIPEGETDRPHVGNMPLIDLSRIDTPAGFTNLGDGVLLSQSEILDFSEGADSNP